MEVRVGDLMTCLNAMLLSSAAALSLFTVMDQSVVCPQKNYDIFYNVIGSVVERKSANSERKKNKTYLVLFYAKLHCI